MAHQFCVIPNLLRTVTVIAHTNVLPKMRRKDVVGFAALPPDVRKVSDLPEMPLFISWGYAPNSGRSPMELEVSATVGQSRHRTSGGRAGKVNQLWMKRIGLSILCCAFVLAAIELAEAQRTPTNDAAPRVFLLDSKHLQATKQRLRQGDKSLAPAMAKLEREAQKALSAGPFSVITKDKTPPSGDKHDYMSQAPYFWPDPNKPKMRELVDYSKQYKVGIWFWKHGKDLRTPDARERFFTLCNNVGVVGAKIDFFDHEAKEIIDLYQTLLREAAEHKIMLEFHGANKPGGESRAWPNEITREAIRGMEYKSMQTR